jgi:hypothetical protein
MDEVSRRVRRKRASRVGGGRIRLVSHGRLRAG